MAIQVDIAVLKEHIAPQHIDTYIEYLHAQAITINNSANVSWARIRHAYNRVNAINDDLVELARIFEVETYINVSKSNDET